MRHLRLLVLSLLLVAPAWAQSSADRDRARIQNRLAWDEMKAEGWANAAKLFQLAIDIDPQFEIPHYGLGRANMAMKKYPTAIAAYTRCRDLYRAQAGRQFSNVQDAQRYRLDRMAEIDEQIRQVQSLPLNARSQDQMRQLQDIKRQLQDTITRGNSLTIDSTVPAFVSLALGSAFFRGGQLAEAEREYKAAIAADSKAGEAHNNLAVVYLETGRITEAEASIKAAKKAGFKVHPQLEQDIKNRKKSDS